MCGPSPHIYNASGFWLGLKGPAADAVGPFPFLGLFPLALPPLFPLPLRELTLLLELGVFVLGVPMEADFTTVVRALISCVSFCREGEALLSTTAASDLTDVDLEGQQPFSASSVLASSSS